MKPAKLDLTFYQGATYRRSFQWQTGATPSPVNLTGYSARMQVRRKLSDPDPPLLELTTQNGGIAITNAAEGRFELFVSASDTAALSFRSGVYDLELVAPSGDVIRLFEGNAILSPEVTR